MKSLFPLAIVAAAGFIAPAHAGTYLGLGIGTSPAVDYPADVQSDGRSGRFLVGARLGKLSIEGSAGRFSAFFDTLSYDTTTLSASLKYSLPLGHNFEAYGRGGLHRSWLTTGDRDNYDAAGNGWLAGGGFEYRLDLALTAASVFVDYQIARASVTNDRMTYYDLTTRMWTLGATLAL